jgi:hypothetical protein
LRDEVLQAELLPFLRSLYPLLYRHPSDYGYVLSQLETLPPAEWLQWSIDESAEAFQYDRYGMSDTLKIGHQRIALFYEALLLSMEGGIGMEEYGRQFLFLKYTMMQAFQSFKLAGALRLSITG